MKDGVQKILAEHIQLGIDKYHGVIDAEIEYFIKQAKLHYKPYLFRDGRVLLVLPNNIAAFLYKDKETLFDALSLES